AFGRGRLNLALWSRASRSCGLKFPEYGIVGRLDSVTSFTLVWIKMPLAAAASTWLFGHELHARVD
ncbi:hypothetical protein, partial [Cloacibacillus evryensis]|uniref:hypothetical protein n=1 Tax=Cloacibacillus evryensis TaxID=508460 RepID=UPI00210A703C